MGADENPWDVEGPSYTSVWGCIQLDNDCCSLADSFKLSYSSSWTMLKMRPLAAWWARSDKVTKICPILFKNDIIGWSGTLRSSLFLRMYSISTVAGVDSFSQTDFCLLFVGTRMCSCGSATGSWLCPLPAASTCTGTTGVIFSCGSATGSWLCRSSGLFNSTRTTGIVLVSTITELIIRGTFRVGMFDIVSLSLRWGDKNSKTMAYLYGFGFSAACPLFGFLAKFRRNWPLMFPHLFLHSNAKKTVITISIIQ